MHQAFPDYSKFNRLILRFAASRPGIWIFSHLGHHADRLVLRLTGGKRTLASILAGVPMVMLSTTGAKSGLPRSSPVVCIRTLENPQCFAVIGSNFGQARLPGWYYNLKAHPRAACNVEGQVGEYIAHEAGPDEYERYWQRALEIYPSYALYKERCGRRIPIMVLEPLN